MKKNIVYPITVSSIMVAMIVTFSTMSIVGLHSLFLQNAIAQQQPTAGANIQTMRPEPEIDKTTALPASNGTKPADTADGGNNQTEPCISPCPPGQICIQMCKPIGQPETIITDPSSASPMNEEQGQQALTQSPEDTMATGEEQQPLNPSDNEDADEEGGGESTALQEPSDDSTGGANP